MASAPDTDTVFIDVDVWKAFNWASAEVSLGCKPLVVFEFTGGYRPKVKQLKTLLKALGHTVVITTEEMG